MVAPGPSARDARIAPDYRGFWTIGCNRAVEFCQPDLAVCFEPFVDKCWPVMRRCVAQFVFAHIHRDRRGKSPHPRIVQVPTKNILDWFRPRRDDPNRELWCAQSPFWGVAIAAWLGFSKVGLIGVDWTEDRYTDSQVTREADKWAEMLALIPDTEVINLNPDSRMKAATFGAIDQIRPKGG